MSAGLVPFAIGSETWGSILSPASHCGIAGLRPTYGRVSRYGAMALSWSLDKLGPLGLTADDCGLVLEAIAGPDPLDPTTTNRPYTYAADPMEKRWRLGVLKGVTADIDESVRSNFAHTLQVLAQVASIEEVGLPELPYEAITRTILFAEAASAFEEFMESGQAAELTAPEDHYGPYVRTAVLAKDYIRALRLRGLIAKQMDAVLAGFDALVGPARAISPTPLDQEFRSAAGGTAQDIMGAIGNSLGLPAIAVPNGFSDKGLPTGVQFMGRAYDENAILAVARTTETLPLAPAPSLIWLHSAVLARAVMSVEKVSTCRPSFTTRRLSRQTSNVLCIMTLPLPSQTTVSWHLVPMLSCWRVTPRLSALMGTAKRSCQVLPTCTPTLGSPSPVASMKIYRPRTAHRLRVAWRLCRYPP